MNYEENGITLGQLLKIIKKSFFKAIICVLIGIFTTSAILLVVRAFTRSNSYDSTITITTEQNDSTLLSKFTINKRLVVASATSKLELSQDLVPEIVANTSITAQFPEKFDEETYFPNVFKISIKPDKKIKLNDNQYVALVDQISTEYVNIFSTVNFPTIISTYERDGVGTSYEYLRYVDGIYSNINSAVSSIQLFISSSGLDANNPKLTDLNILLTQLLDLLNSTEQLRQYIISNSIEITDGSITKYLNVEESIAQSEIDKYSKLVSTSKSALDSYSNVVSNITNGSNSAGNIYYLNDENFIRLTKELMHYQQLEANAIERKAKILTYKTINSNATSKTDAAVNHTTAQFSSITSNFDTLINTYNDIEIEYNSNQSLTSKAQVTLPASKNVSNLISMVLLIVIDILVALIIYSVVFFKTLSTEKKLSKVELKEQTEQ